MKTKNMVNVAMLAAIVCALGIIPPIPVPISPVPITMQTLGVMLAGGLLGARWGGLSMVVFLAIVAIGAPVLSGGRGGLAVFVSPTAGFLLSFPISAFVIGFLTERFWNRLTIWKALLINIIGGVVLAYIIGAPVLAMITNMGLGKAFMANVVFLPGDITKTVIAAYVTVKMKAAYPLIERNKASAISSRT